MVNFMHFNEEDDDMFWQRRTEDRGRVGIKSGSRVFFLEPKLNPFFYEDGILRGLMDL